MKLYGGDYVWILASKSNDEKWWQDEKYCPKSRLSKAVNGLILVSSQPKFEDGQMPISGRVKEELLKSVPKPISKRVKETQDAAWAAGLSIRKALKSVPACPPSTQFKDERVYCYSGWQFQQNILHNMRTIRFQGLSGPVMFNGTDRVTVTNFQQIQGGEKVTVAVYDPLSAGLSFKCKSCSPLIWPNGYVPIVKRTYELQIVTVEPIAFYLITLLSFAGIITCASLLAFNFHFRKHRYIKLSSPSLNSTMIVGCMLIYIAVIILGIDEATIPSVFTFNTICTARVMFMSAGFSLAFGSIFAKTYRVHQIFIKRNHGIMKNKILQDSRLVPLVGIFILIDGIIIILWSKIDPMERQLHNLTLVTSVSQPTLIYQTQVEVCKSNNKTGWFLALYIYKGLLFIVGLYMTWETRNVNIPSLNDSKYVCLSVYCIVVTSPFLFILTDISEHSNQITLTYLTRSLLILIITSACVSLLFVPKICVIMKHKGGVEDHIMESLGLKFECNTIRFVKDDEHELYYRAEVQNQAYRKDIMTLDKEISKLHRELYFPAALFPQTRRTTSARIYDKLPRFRKYSREKSSSLSEGIPMLLLSVLPVVIPRASWPCADPNDPHVIQEEVEFSSDTKLLHNTRQYDKQECGSNLQISAQNSPKTFQSEGVLQNSYKQNDGNEKFPIPNNGDFVSNNNNGNRQNEPVNLTVCEAIIHNSIKPEDEECKQAAGITISICEASD